MNQDVLRTPVKPFESENKKDAYAETKKPENMKKEFTTEVSDFREEIQNYMEISGDDIERQIAEKLEKRIKNFLGKHESETNINQNHQESKEFSRLEASLEEKCKNITLKSLMVSINIFERK